MKTQVKNSKPIWWTGVVLKVLLSLFLFFDAIMKIVEHPQYVQGTKDLGLPEASVQFLGIYLLISTLLYILPKTVMLGGLFLTAYLGAAAAITYSAAISGHPYIFPVVFAILLWVAEYLRNERVKKVLPLFTFVNQ